ncbi:unnamed protein product [Ostreobium quekettii]|uniref:Protein kinase domain-containing protein n=1 Tax=Ostreobium quekettii TaxID=121088 RepID=A0A8S1J483_9CHLO|nr:unnamed protein product [Ostreobium quekettii]
MARGGAAGRRVASGDGDAGLGQYERRSGEYRAGQSGLASGMTSGGSISLSQRAQGRFLHSEDHIPGCRVVRDINQTCFSSSKDVNCMCFPAFTSKPIKTIMFAEQSRNMWWVEGGRFIIKDVSTSDSSKTPRKQLRRSVRCMAHCSISGSEYIWTGHRWGEVCVWDGLGRQVTKSLKAFRSCVRSICMVSPYVAWVGADSGNIRVIQLHLGDGEMPAELTADYTLAPSECPVGRLVSGSNYFKSGPLTRPTNQIDTVPEDGELTSSGTDPSKSSLRVCMQWTAARLLLLLAMVHYHNPVPGRMVNRSTGSYVGRLSEAMRNMQWHNRAHRSHIRCIFAKGGRVWSSGGRVWYLGTIKMWSENYILLGKFLCESRGPCSSFASVPWHRGQGGSADQDAQDWRLLTAHDSGKLLLWDPGLKSLQPLLEIEFRKSPIRSLVVWESMGLMCTAHRDGSVQMARLPTPQIRGLTSSTPVVDEDEIYPFVPRTIAEFPHPSGLRCAVGGHDCLFTVSDRGRILYWPREKLEANMGELRQSSMKRMIVNEVNESVRVVDREELTVGETIWEGDFATVKKGKYLAKDIIIKEANNKADSRKAMRALVKDAQILSTVRHPNIVNILAVCGDPPFVVMQYYEEGSLYDVLRRARADPRVMRRLTCEKRLGIAIAAGCGMHFLHSQRNQPILHRDLKSPNIFVDRDFVSACVGDFNLSKDSHHNLNQNLVSSARPSNPMWLAPEVAKGRDFTIAADVYSFGIILWELLTGRTPWDHLKPANGQRLNKENFYSKIRYELFQGGRPPVNRLPDGRLEDPPWGKFNQLNEYVALMQQCWEDEPMDRPPSFEAIVFRLEEIKREESAASRLKVLKLKEMPQVVKETEMVAEGVRGDGSGQGAGSPSGVKAVMTEETDAGVVDPPTATARDQAGDGIEGTEGPSAPLVAEPVGGDPPAEEGAAGEPTGVGGGGGGHESGNLDPAQDPSESSRSSKADKGMSQIMGVVPPLPASPFDMPANQQVAMGRPA